MKRFFLRLVVVLALLAGTMNVMAQNQRRAIMFYNVENLFDTVKDPVTYDEEFTPGGAKAWTETKYWKKMANIEKVFHTFYKEYKQFPSIIGLSEVENRNVLEDLISMKKLRPANYQIVHYDSPDPRGVDVAFIYRPDHFQYEGSSPEKTVVEELPNFRTRDILTMWGTMEGEKFFFMVAHWPSRLGGQMASEFKRIGAAKTMRQIADSVRLADPSIKIVMMGDLNDDPSDKSIAEYLGAQLKAEETPAGGLFNPYYQMHKDGFGTLAYQDAWNLFDNIIVSGNLVNNSGGFQIWKSDKSKYYGNIFDRAFLRQRSGQYKGYPLRTYVGNKFENGYSDHFPVYIFIAK